MIGPVEKNIPMPARKGRELSEMTQKLLSMQVGDSIHCTTRHDAQLVANRLNQMGKKIVSRREANGWRVWLMAEAGNE